MSFDITNLSTAEKKQLIKQLQQETNPSITSKDTEIQVLHEQVKKTAADRKVTPTEVMTALLKALRIGGRIGRGLSDDGEPAKPKVARKPRGPNKPKAAKPANLK